MKPLKTFGATLALMLVLAATALAGISETPPCAPGETSSPPCASASMTSDDAAPGQTNTPPATNAGSEFSFTGLALDVIESALLFF